jgi:ectoine hydroxylase-related dioxygenase (phytanoyl-CoA dioxygenase family)
MNIKEIQKKKFDQKGFIKISNFFSKSELIELNKLVESVENLKPIKGKSMMYFDKIKNNLILTRTENFYAFHRGMNRFLKKKKINKLISFFMNAQPVLFKDKINWKYPGAGGFEPHQDAQVWENLYKNVKNFLSLTISINKTTEKNGCLEVAEKRHKEGLFGDNSSAIPKNIVKKFNWKKITTRPGDLILFGAYTPHRSKKNKTNKPRKMIYLTYNAKKDGDLRNKYFKDKRKNYPPNNERIKGKKYKYLI